MALKLMYITNNPEVALIAEKNGVDRIWIDLETLGKEERQKNINSVKSHHTIEDIEKISKIMTKSEVMVRINPYNENSEEEIKRVIEAGADIIMLPMWKSQKEVEKFIKSVNGQVKTILLLETKEAVECLDNILEEHRLGNINIDEIHIGLNDLHLSYGLTFMFELLSNGIVEKICKKISKYNIPYGFGGIARIGEGMLPAECIVKEHYRLGSNMVILSRSFCDTELVKDVKEIETIFLENVMNLRNYEYSLELTTNKEYEENTQKISESVDQIVKIMKERKINGR